MRREELKKIIEENGGKAAGSISNSTNYLLAGLNPGPDKIKKATNMEIQIISEEYFIDNLLKS
jgi:DNA ligase (NAD+)